MFCNGTILCCTAKDIERLTLVGLGEGLLIRSPLREAISRVVGDHTMLREQLEALQARLDAEAAAKSKAEAELSAARQKLAVLEAQAKSKDNLTHYAIVRKEFYKAEYAKAITIIDGVVKALAQGRPQMPPNSPDISHHSPSTDKPPPPTAAGG